MGHSVHVSVVELDPVLEAGAISALTSCPYLTVTAAPRAAEVVLLIASDVGTEVLDLVRAQRRRPRCPEVIIVAPDFTLAEARRAIAIGACGLVRCREADGGRLTRAVLAASTGDCTVPPDMLTLLVYELTPGARTLDPRPSPGLSEREHTVLNLIADGHETDEIARELCYSTRTVVGVVQNITYRFRLRNRAHAVAYAIRAGML
jgi:DNA-binding NarL/FixJ family response regulator